MTFSIFSRIPRAQRPERLLFRPRVVDRLERDLSRWVPISANGVSLFKVLVVAPSFVVGLMSAAPGWWLFTLFVCFLVLDFVDGAVAKGRGEQTTLGCYLDRLCDLPVLAGIWWAAGSVLPALAVAVKLSLDAVLLFQFLRGVESTESRVRTSLHYAALGAALAVAQGWLPALFSPALVQGLFWACAGFSLLVVLNNAGWFKRRFIADSLSLLNFSCGVASIALASSHHFASCIVCLLLGAAFDGFDGAAARRWGGTRIGVVADDVADGMNYGVAPGVASYFALGDWDGVLLGALFALFTIMRLVYFTLAKTGSDPRYFQGAPSTVGGLVVLSGLALFEASPAKVGLLVGAACVLMVSFATSHRHLGRLLAERPRLLLALPGVVVLLLAGYPLFGATWPIAWILTACLVYALLPVFSAFRKLATPTSAA